MKKNSKKGLYLFHAENSFKFQVTMRWSRAKPKQKRFKMSDISVSDGKVPRKCHIKEQVESKNDRSHFFFVVVLRTVSGIFVVFFPPLIRTYQYRWSITWSSTPASLLLYSRKPMSLHARGCRAQSDPFDLFRNPNKAQLTGRFTVKTSSSTRSRYITQ